MLELVRIQELKEGIFGRLVVNGMILATVEPVYKDRYGAIEPGEYQLVPHTGSRYKDVVALVNHDLGVYHSPDRKAKRVGILIHAANFARQLRGCIAPGLSQVKMVDKETAKLTPAVSQSVAAVSFIMKYLSKQPIKTWSITITEDWQVRNI